MSEISTLGNGVGFIYVMEPNGTSFVSSLVNISDNARLAKGLGLQAASLALNQAATGKITITACTGNGSVTQILIDGIDQINSAAGIAYTAATTPTQLAALIVTEINNYTPAGNNYTALSIAGVVYIFAPQSAGSSVNDLPITVSNTGNLTFTTAGMSGGSTASQVYDENTGYRFFLNATAAAIEGSITGATEITNFLVQRGVQAATDAQSLTIASGAITVTRKSAVTQLIVDTEGTAAADDLTDIIPTGWAEWDTVIIRGTDAARVITVKTTGNINLAGSNNFTSGDYTKTLILQYRSGDFYEVSRSSQQIGSIADYRIANFPFVTDNDYTVNTITAAGGTVTLTPNVSKKVQQFLGTATLAAHYTINFAGTPIAGDEFWLIYESFVTLNGFELRISGVLTYKLTTTQALRGGLILYCRYTSVGWLVGTFYNFSQSTSNPPKIEALFVEDNTLTPAKLTAEGRTEVIVIDVSFETGYTNATNKIEIPYGCTVKKISAISTKAIAGTDNAQIILKNNAGTTMTGGTLTFTASDAQNTQYSSTVTANNTAVDGDYITILSTKTTAGGAAKVSIKIERS